MLRRSAAYSLAGTLHVWTLLTILGFYYFPVFLDTKADREATRSGIPWPGVLLLLAFPPACMLIDSARCREWVASRISPRLHAPIRALHVNLHLWAVLVSWHATGRVVWDAGREWAGILYFLYWLNAGLAAYAMSAGGSGLGYLSGSAHTLAWLTDRPLREPPLPQSSLYRYSRNPVLTYSVVAVWLTPLMTVDRLIWAGFWTIFAVFAARVFEQRFLRDHGKRYAEYRSRVPRWFPLPRRRRSNEDSGNSE